MSQAGTSQRIVQFIRQIRTQTEADRGVEADRFFRVGGSSDKELAYPVDRFVRQTSDLPLVCLFENLDGFIGVNPNGSKMFCE